MPDLNALLSQRFWRAVSANTRAVRAWQRIQDNPISVVIMRGASDLTAQSVRIEPDLSARENSGSAGTAAVQRMIVFGIEDHPTLADTNIAKGDRFVLNSADEYRVMDVVRYPGEVQATAERVR